MRRVLFIFSVATSLAVPMLARGATAPSPTDPAAIEFFEKKVRPLLVDNCYNCHSANTNAKGGLRVDDRNGLISGGDKGSAIVPGNPEKSLLIQAVKQSGEVKMPPKKHLSDEQIAILATWIKDGAAWPRTTFTLAAPPPKYENLRKEHWAWQPLKNPASPAVRDAAWPRGDIDRFILAELEAKNLGPVVDADKTNLLRRVTFDLTGLPPTPAEIDEFLADNSTSAYETVVDRLLASPAFGERWGRHWLDVARYGESTGSSRNLPYPQAWRYRDYVINSFNIDKPYDQFIREQIAGDLLPAKSRAEHDEHAIATGFLALGVKDVNQRFKVRYIMDNVDEQIDTVSRSVLALTVSCARCHDHKFDPIPTADYYSLAGIFQSTDLCAGLRNKMGGGGMAYYDTEMLIPIGDHKVAVPPNAEQMKKDLEEARKAWFAIRGTPEGLTKDANGLNKQRPFRLKYEKLEAEVAAFNDPAASGEIALGVRDGKNIADTEVRIRGEAEKLGPVIPRGFLSLVSYVGEPKVGNEHSGRLELAEWLTSPKNPLTPRVMANRVWGNLFGEGLVKSVDNFGTTGDVPSNPALLDHLAGRFIQDGWSVKKLTREIVLSHAYQLSADDIAVNSAINPADRLIWRHNPRRLEGEEIRDATLAAAGKLDASRPTGEPAADKLKVRELPNNGAEAARIAELARGETHRSVYLPLLRGLTPTSLEVFDFAEQGMVTGHRDATTVATQALYLLNDPFVRRNSLNLAQRVLGEKNLNDDQRIELAYHLTLSRSATSQEIDRARRFIHEFQEADAQVVGAPPTETKPKSNTEPEAVAVANSDATDADGGSGTAKASAAPVNPDEIVPVAQAVKDEVVQPKTAQEAAWAAFSQALLGSAEFRYLK